MTHVLLFGKLVPVLSLIAQDLCWGYSTSGMITGLAAPQPASLSKTSTHDATCYRLRGRTARARQPLPCQGSEPGCQALAGLVKSLPELMIDELAGVDDGEIGHVGELSQAHASGPVDVAEDDLLLWAVQCAPGLDPALERAADAGVKLGMATDDLPEKDHGT